MNKFLKEAAIVVKPSTMLINEYRLSMIDSIALFLFKEMKIFVCEGSSKPGYVE